MGARNYNYDAFNVLSDGLTAYTTAQIAKVSAANKILDYGGALTRTDIGLVGSLGREDFNLIIDVSAMTLGATNLYDILIMGSNNSSGTNAAVLGGIRLGNTAVMPNSGATSVIGRYEVPFTDEQADIKYEYVYLWVVPQGTSPSITFTGWVAKQAED